MEDGNEIGSIETTMAEMVMSENGLFNGKLHDAMDAEVGNIIVQIEEVQPQKEQNEETFLTVPESITEKMVRFKYRWENLNNWSSGFFGIGKQRQRVRFEIGRYNTSAKKFSKIRSTPFVKQLTDSTYRIPTQLYTISQICNNKMN